MSQDNITITFTKEHLQKAIADTGKGLCLSEYCIAAQAAREVIPNFDISCRSCLFTKPNKSTHHRNLWVPTTNQGYLDMRRLTMTFDDCPEKVEKMLPLTITFKYGP